MAGLSAINAVTSGLAQYLTRAHQISPIKATTCLFTSVSTGEFKKLDANDTTCSLFLYRVSQNGLTRNPVTIDGRRPPLTLNLHLLLTVWADSAQKEQLLFAWVMREVNRLAVLDRSVLGTAAAFDAGDLVQLSTEDISMDDLSKLWQMLAPPYRLSATFVARNVRIDADDDEVFPPVVAKRLGFSAELENA